MDKLNELPYLLQYSDTSQKDIFKTIMIELKDINSRKYDVIDLCFMIDSTGSMECYLNLVRDSIENIQKGFQEWSIQKNCPLRVSCVCYRDIKDDIQKEVFDFSEDIDAFKTFLSKVKAEGGGDTCEDVLIGLKQVNNLKWNESSLKVCSWIADSPCHGSKYHNLLSDDFLDRKENEKVEEEIKKLAENEISLFFFEITEHTQKMIVELQKIYKSICHKSIEQIQLNFSTTQSQFLQKMFHIFDSSQQLDCFINYNSQLRKIKQNKKYGKLEQFSKNLVQTIESQQARLIEENQDLPLNVYVQEYQIKNFYEIKWEQEIEGDIIIYSITSDNTKLKIQSKQSVILKKAEKPFAKGAFKYCYIAQNISSGNILVLKQYIRKHKNIKNNLLFEVYVNLLSQKIMKAYKECLKKADSDNKKLNYQSILFVPELSIFQHGKNYYLIEQFKHGHSKYINNDGQITQNNENIQVFESFVHFSFCYSNKNFMITDIQGFNKQLNDIGIHSQPMIDKIANNKNNNSLQELNQMKDIPRQNKFLTIQNFKFEYDCNHELNLNDPDLQIHHEGNLGSIGIANFFKAHTCNLYCKILKLEPYDIDTLINQLEPVADYCTSNENLSFKDIDFELMRKQYSNKKKQKYSLSPCNSQISS